MKCIWEIPVKALPVILLFAFIIDSAGPKKAPAWRRGLSKAGASSTVYIQYTIHPPSFNQIIKEL
ncbi:MAG: hypothetical protein A2Z38_09420 [Planctomycetes bacterium RBG_19FT_COMBO_48_8]|nr:MAG: hypothetical protein A2Z38_09420 [Planctomycetes bacterium RBG_19FT_COMBO_48_8]